NRRARARARAAGGPCPRRSPASRRPAIGVEDVDLAEARRRAAVTDRVRLARLALAVAERAAEVPRRRSADEVARLPELERVRLIRDVLDHPRLLAVLDLPERLTAELEIQPLVVDRPRAA